MLIEKMIKKVLILGCATALAACSSTPDSNVEEDMPVDNSPVVETVTEPVISEEERMRQQSEEMVAEVRTTTDG